MLPEPLLFPLRNMKNDGKNIPLNIICLLLFIAFTFNVYEFIPKIHISH